LWRGALNARLCKAKASGGINHRGKQEVHQVDKLVKYLGKVARLSKRVALAELIGSYLEERDAMTAMPRKRRKRELPHLSPKDRFPDLLFPETKDSEEQDQERAKDSQGKTQLLDHFGRAAGQDSATVRLRNPTLPPSTAD
jgi:hypothetical protein